jgi:hypothetical protein
MKRFLTIFRIFVTTASIVGVIMGGLLFLLVWPPQSDVSSQEKKIACGQNDRTPLCLIKSYLQPQDPEEVWQGIIKE